jgi:hypothetical protein
VILLVFFSNLGCNSFGPDDLSIFREFNCFKTISSFMISSGMFSLIFIGFGFGISPSGSSVKTLEV